MGPVWKLMPLLSGANLNIAYPELVSGSLEVELLARDPETSSGYAGVMVLGFTLALAGEDVFDYVFERAGGLLAFYQVILRAA